MLKRLRLDLLLLTMVLLPLTQHCVLQVVGVFQNDCIVTQTTGTGHHSPCSIEASSLKAAANHKKNFEIAKNLAFLETGLDIQPRSEPGSVLYFSYNAPELLNSWAFLYGQAKPARAPCIVV